MDMNLLFKERMEDENADQVDSIMPPADIIAFNELRSCADIYRMYEKGQLDVDPDFQRGEVWPQSSQTLFVDSLMKQLPIPSLCISLDLKTQRRLVIDGLQRITTIIKFLDEHSSWKLSCVNSVDSRIAGKSVAYIRENEPVLYSVLENVTIPITVIRCDYSKVSHMEYLFQIFYRLNSGGSKLYNQEIRNCIYQGQFNSMLKRVARSEKWMNFANTNEDRVNKARFNNEERILRFFALYDKRADYKGSMATFLNEYMCEKRYAETYAYELLIYKTLDIAGLINDRIESKNVAEAVLLGIAFNLDKLTNDAMMINDKYQRLLEKPEFSQAEMKEGLSGKEKVNKRIDAAISAFSND